MEKEDSRTLEFGDFSDAKCLTNSEVYLLLSQKRDIMRDTIPNSVFHKSFEYVEKFGSANGDKNTCIQIRRELSKEEYDLHEFEIAQLTNLLPTKIDETKVLIPSLQQKEDEVIQKIVDFLAPYAEQQVFEDDDDEEEDEEDEENMETGDD